MEKEETINWLYYEIGKQPESFKLTYSFMKDGVPIFLKHEEFLTLLEEKNMWKLKKVNHRNILKNELVIDIDCNTKKESEIIMKKITEELLQKNICFKCFFTGSRGYHIHLYKRSWLYCSREERELEKRAIIEYYQSDKMKVYDNTLIAIEETPHWKTGIKKILVRKNGFDEN